MRAFITFLQIVLCVTLFCHITGCAMPGSTSGGLAVPLKAVGSASGDMTGPQVFIAGVPVNALVKVHGNVKYTVQPMPPYVTLDGDYTIIVEPLPGQEPAAQEAVNSGALLIRRRGKPGALNAPGSIQSFKEMRELRYAESQRVHVPAARKTPPPPPPPAPLEEAKPIGSVEGDFCDPNDPACQLPRSATH